LLFTNPIQKKDVAAIEAIDKVYSQNMGNEQWVMSNSLMEI